MNYLAHLHLAGNEEESIVGNFLGDFVKGPLNSSALSAEIKKGIHMHRRVDRLADGKIISLLDSQQLNFKYRRYAGICFDLACDHFLAKHWQEFSAISQSEFSSHRIGLLKDHDHLLNHKAKLVLERMETYRWLENYQNIEFMRQVFKGIHKRFPKENSIDKAFMDLDNNYTKLEEKCLAFINELLSSTELINQKR